MTYRDCLLQAVRELGHTPHQLQILTGIVDGHPEAAKEIPDDAVPDCIEAAKDAFTEILRCN